jgi:Na+/H+-dicarboxylate symporter
MGMKLVVSSLKISLPVSHLNASSVFSDLVPTSIFSALASNDVLQILVFAVFFGLAIRRVGEKAHYVKELLMQLAQVAFSFCRIVIAFAPLGIYAILAQLVGSYGLNVLLPLLKLVLAVYLSCAVLIMIYSLILLANRFSLKHFYTGTAAAIGTAYTTSSSASTLPITIRCAKENLGIDSNLAQFLLPLGTSLNLSGLSIYLSVVAVFSAHLFNIHLGLVQYLTMILSIIAMSCGAAAIPGSALVVMSAVVQSIGVPVTAVPMIAGVDRFNDMAQTATNVISDLFSLSIIAKLLAKDKVETAQELARAPHLSE